MNISTYSNLPKFVVNLPNRKDRLKSFQSKLGKDFEVFPAIYGKDLTYEELDKVWDMDKSQNFYKMTPMPGQIGCTLSHYALYQKIANDSSLEDNDWALIVEDDIVFRSDFEERLNAILEQLAKEQFLEAQIVFLHFQQFSRSFDYVNHFIKLEQDNSPYLLAYQKELASQKAKENPNYNYQRMPIEAFLGYYGSLTANIRVNPFAIFSFPVANANNTNEHGYDEKLEGEAIQRLFATYYYQPSATCAYLIRKKQCKEIINRHPKAWWLTDDFKALFHYSKILFASPNLVTVELENISSISSVKTDLYYLNTRLNPPYYKYCNFIHPKLKRSLANIYHSDPKVRRKAKLILGFYGLRR